MIRDLRIVGLAARINLRTPGKFGLLVVLVAVGSGVFLLVQALSAASTESLDRAVAQESGVAGSYEFTIPTGLGLRPDALAAQVEAVVGPLSSTPLRMYDLLPATTPECPPGETLTAVVLVVARDSQGRGLRAPHPHLSDTKTVLCLGGQHVPAEAIGSPPPGQERQWGTSLFLDSDYEQLALLASVAPVSHRFVFTLPESQRGRVAFIQDALAIRLAAVAARAGVDPEGLVTVNRVDQDSATRAASAGVKLVYGIIGWGVLLLGGLGILVAELIVLRDRTWFFGLARAIGATGRHIALLVIADIVLIVSLGMALAVAAAAAAQPTVAQFGRDTFQVNLTLLRSDVVPELAFGALLILVVGGCYPAYRAIRLDPLRVLESR